jgi:hypothetical protein
MRPSGKSLTEFYVVYVLTADSMPTLMTIDWKLFIYPVETIASSAIGVAPRRNCVNQFFTHSNALKSIKIAVTFSDQFSRRHFSLSRLSCSTQASGRRPLLFFQNTHKTKKMFLSVDARDRFLCNSYIAALWHIHSTDRTVQTEWKKDFFLFSQIPAATTYMSLPALATHTHMYL